MILEFFVIIFNIFLRIFVVMSNQTAFFMFEEYFEIKKSFFKSH